MSATSVIRSRVQNLLTGDYAPIASFSIETGRFRLWDRDLGQIEKNYDSTSERRFQVVVQNLEPIVPINHLDGFALYNAELVVKVAYFYTHLGDDMPEGTAELSGTGYYDEILDRANTDYHDIQRVLTYYQNYGSLTTEVFSIEIASYKVSEVDRKLISEITFKTSFQAPLVTVNSSWTPASIDDLFAWYRSDTVTLSSGKVSQLTDKSGNGRHATQATPANRPAYSATGGLNNLPYFSTTESYSTGTGLSAGTTGTWNFLHNGTGATVFVVAKTTGIYWLWLMGTQATGISNIGYSISSTSDPGNQLSISVGNGTNVVAGFGLNGLIIDPSTYHKFISSYKTATTTYGDALYVKVDNRDMATPASRSPSSSNSGALGIGYGGTGLYPATSEFHEIIIFNRQLSSTEIAQVEEYLYNRYGI